MASTILSQSLSQVQGVGEVQIGGSSLPAVRIELEPQALNQYGVALDDVRNTIANANVRRPKGSVEDGQRLWQVQANDQLEKKAKDYESLIIHYADGAALRLKDVAKVSDGVEDRYNSGFFNDDAAVLLVINRQAGANIIETVSEIKAQLPALQAVLPASVKLNLAMDRSPVIKATLHEAEMTLLIAVVLVILVVFLFLGNFRASLIPTLAVPVSLVGTFAVMYLYGFSLNNLSLMALILATGLVVDDAIVVLENISRHIDKGVPPMKAAYLGAEEVGFTLLSMNVSLVAVFLSILFMGGIIESLFREFFHHLGGGHCGVVAGVADIDADALRALAQAAYTGAGKPPATLEPADQRVDGRQIRQQPRLGAASPSTDLAQPDRDDWREYRVVCRCS